MTVQRERYTDAYHAHQEEYTEAWSDQPNVWRRQLFSILVDCLINRIQGKFAGHGAKYHSNCELNKK